LGTQWTAHYNRKTKNIVGVTTDFHFLGMKENAEPLVLDIEKSLLRAITLSLDGRKASRALAAVEKTWRRHFPGAPFEYAFLDEAFGMVYQYEERMGQLLALVSGLGIAIAFLGLYGLVAFFTQTRKKEIGVRRVLGASTMAIALLMTRQFISLVILAGLTASSRDYPSSPLPSSRLS
jgi:putative ABC transport system permease protein